MFKFIDRVQCSQLTFFSTIKLAPGPFLCAVSAQTRAVRKNAAALNAVLTMSISYVLVAVSCAAALEIASYAGAATSSSFLAPSQCPFLPKTPLKNLRLRTVRHDLKNLRGGDEAFEDALEMRAQGAKLWSKGNYTGAAQYFTAALTLLNNCSTASILAHREECINCLNNRAATFFKLEAYDAAISDSTEALALDPSNKKV
jgi:tetratricopeptide (TPR) repeat protein